MSLKSFEAAFAPRPNLRGDQVNDGHLAFFEMREEVEVKAGAIGEDGEVGLFLVNGAFQFAEFAVNARDVGDHLDEADDGERGGIDDGTNAGLTHAGSGTAEEVGVGVECADGFGELSGVPIARGFTGGDEDFQRQGGLWTRITFGLGSFARRRGDSRRVGGS